MDRIGVDVGGTFIKAGVVRDEQLVSKLQVPTENEKGTEQVLRNIARAVELAAGSVGKTVKDFSSAGFGIPGAVDDKTGTVVMCPNLCSWRNFPFAPSIEKLLPLKAYVGNDANCAVLGETVAGAAKGASEVVLLTLGTGVGGGIISNGRLVTGHLGLGAELGHFCLVPNGELCGCGMRGCLEAYCSVTSLLRETRKAMAADPGSLMHAYAAEAGQVDGRTSFECAKKGDAAALRVVNEYIDHLALGIGSLITVFRPEVVLLGGGLSNQGAYLTDRVTERLPRYVFASGFSELPPVRKATLGNDAGTIGAAYLG